MSPTLRLYAGSLTDAYDLIHDKRLRRCDPLPQSLWVYALPSSAAVTAVALGLENAPLVDDNAMLIPDYWKRDADATLQQLDLSASVQIIEMFGIEVWGEEAEAAFDAAFG